MRNQLSPRTFPGLLFILISLALLGWAYWPLTFQEESVELRNPELNGLLLGQSGEGKYQITFSWTPRSRLGEKAYFILQLIPSERQGGDTGSSQGTPVDPFLIEGRVEASGMQVAPPGEVTQIGSQGGKLKFSWEMTAQTEGNKEYTIWLYFSKKPETGKQADFQPFLSRKFEVEWEALFGLPIWIWQIIGFVLFFSGVLWLAVGVLRRKRGHFRE